MRKHKIIVSCFCSEVIITLVTMLKSSNKNLDIIAGFLEKNVSASSQAIGLHWLHHGDKANEENNIFLEADAIVCLLDPDHILELTQLAARHNKPLIICSSADSGVRDDDANVHIIHCDYHNLEMTLSQLKVCVTAIG